jgi:hypothetical protein
MPVLRLQRAHRRRAARALRRAPRQRAPSRSPNRGLLRKSAIRRFLKNEFDFPLQVREAFFVAMEAKFSDDLRRSVARARELRRNTLMAPDA